MTDRDILDRLEACEMELQAYRGYFKALEYTMHTLVATHPDPAGLNMIWSHVLPEAAEHQSGTRMGGPLFHAAFQQAMGAVTEHVLKAAELHRAPR